ncbi:MULTISPECIES: low specificity L-threonine aldolase [unclassified Bosea (in: a-proteobacteria)]|uniref:threonine aldolase family protein n=1 Tax=unclassified Bosea (in: a-proteobacteria) TaxID=2653178 RepID=UPI000956E72F|nr:MULTISPECIES: low specificity L-threonine aldolase [unclassified Bosea (in: a-proteobacteria)]TAJ29764.1 MAG: low specificity L-threonine aldolase [Bosea sp. (in: a-proteobacteria)]SIQ60283.1 L-threonine aldolase [Bosea sp. TND4EK4]
MNFISDNAAGASPRVMAALAAANDGPAAGYGADDWTKRVEERLSAIFEHEVAAFLVTTGTAANALALASVVRPWGAVITHEVSHIVEDECGAPEFFSDGAKLVDLPGPGAKLSPEAVTQALHHLPQGNVHNVQAQALSITQATECGTIYTPAEVAALREASAASRLTFHMDGARFANALVSLGCTPAEITWKAGIDVLSFGGTKNGAWAAEAVVFFDPARADEMKWRRKRAGQTLSKGRFLGAQFEGLLANDHWLDLARHANAQATRLAQAVEAGGKARLAWPAQANEVFILLPAELDAALKAAGVRYHAWSSRSLAPGNALRAGEIVARFVMSFATDPAEVERLTAHFN